MLYSGFLLGGFRRYQPVVTVVQVACHLCRPLVYSYLLGMMKHASFEKLIKNDIELWNSFKPEIYVDSRVANKLSSNSCTVYLTSHLHSWGDTKVICTEINLSVSELPMSCISWHSDIPSTSATEGSTWAKYTQVLSWVQLSDWVFLWRHPAERLFSYILNCKVTGVHLVTLES